MHDLGKAGTLNQRAILPTSPAKNTQEVRGKTRPKSHWWGPDCSEHTAMSMLLTLVGVMPPPEKTEMI